MRITLNSETGAADGRTSAYAQYRVFDTFRSRERGIAHVRVWLSGRNAARNGAVTCTVTIDFVAGDSVSTHAAAHWPYAAIDLAVARAWRRTSTRRAGQLDAATI